VITTHLRVSLFNFRPNKRPEAVVPFLGRPSNELERGLDAVHSIVKLSLDRNRIWLFGSVSEKDGIIAELGRNMAAETGGGVAQKIPVAREWDLEGKERGGNVVWTGSEEGTVLGEGRDLHLNFLPWQLTDAFAVQDRDVQRVTLDDFANYLVDRAIEEVIRL
jgi:hypothetical protein